MSDRDLQQASEFWRFSLTFYAGPEVPAACLQLQDDCGVDVNVVLFALFLARAGRLLGEDDMARIEALSSHWRDNVVRPLRLARRFTKSPPPAFDDAGTASLRTEVKRIELEAERLQQLCLERSFPAGTTGTANPDVRYCARHNLAAYAHRMGPLPREPVDVLLRRLHDA